MRYQKIESKIWNDEKFSRLSPSQQLLFFYLLTCPHGNLIGCYVLKEGYVCSDLKVLPKDFRKDLAKLLEKGLVKYDFECEILLIPNFLKHNPLTNPNQKKAAAKILQDLPKSALLQHIKGLIEGLPEGLWEVLSKPETETETETETENPPIPPLEGGATRRFNGRSVKSEFPQFWATYPRRTQKALAEKAYAKALTKNRLPPLHDLIGIIDKQKDWPQWTRDEGQFIPHPATWLNQERWNDEPPEDPNERKWREAEAKYGAQ